MMILSATSMVLTKVSMSEQKTVYFSSTNIKLSNGANVANNIINRSIDSIIDTLDLQNANINFIDSSSNPLEIVQSANSNAASISDISNQIINDNGANYNLNAAPSITGNFNINLNRVYRDLTAINKIYYDIKITSTVCDENNLCVNKELGIIKSRTCPTPAQGTMQAMVNAELPDNKTYAIGDLYCTCVQAGLNKTTSNGDCISTCQDGEYGTQESCLPCSANNCKVCTSNVCSECKAGFYLFNATCTACPTSVGVASCSPTGLFTCATGYYRNSNNTDCLLCTDQIGVATCDPATGAATSCLAGYGLQNGSCNPCVPGTYSSGGNGSCINCSDGYYTKIFRETACNTPCANLGYKVATCTTTGTITSCQSGYTLVNNICTATPTTCPIGYTLYNGVTCCPPNSSPTGTGYDLKIGCKCINSRFHGDSRFTIGSIIYSACDLTCGGNLGLFGGSEIIIQNRVDVLAGTPGGWGYCSYTSDVSSCSSSCQAWGYATGQAYQDQQSCVCRR